MTTRDLAREFPDLEYVSLHEAARLLGVTRWCLYRKLTCGEAPELGAVKVYGRWRIPVSAIRRLYQAPPKLALITGRERDGRGA